MGNCCCFHHEQKTTPVRFTVQAVAVHSITSAPNDENTDFVFVTILPHHNNNVYYARGAQVHDTPFILHYNYPHKRRRIKNAMRRNARTSLGFREHCNGHGAVLWYEIVTVDGEHV